MNQLEQQLKLHVRPTEVPPNHYRFNAEVKQFTQDTTAFPAKKKAYLVCIDMDSTHWIPADHCKIGLDSAGRVVIDLAAWLTKKLGLA